MRRRRGRAIAGLALAVLARTAAAGAAGFPARQARVVIDVDAAAIASVAETYELTAPIDRAAFEILTVPCSRVGPIASSIDGRPVALVPARGGAWTTLDAAGVSAAAGATWRIAYAVRTGGGDASVPLVVPAATLDGVTGTRGAAVTIAIAFAGGGEPTLPRFDRQAGRPGWRADLLALPSLVRVRVPPLAQPPCDAAVTGSSGGLEWRFAIFVTTMAIWVPVYLWWFGRRRTGEDD